MNTLSQQVETLKNISKLEVKARKEKYQNVYEFYSAGNNIKTCFTYPKAKIFAEGIFFGRKLYKDQS